jgi:hypothetical protein
LEGSQQSVDGRGDSGGDTDLAAGSAESSDLAESNNATDIDALNAGLGVELKEEQLVENLVQPPAEIKIDPLPALPTPEMATPESSTINETYAPGLSASMTIGQPVNKIAALNPAPQIQPALQSIANIQSQNLVAQNVPVTASIQEPAAVVIEPEPIIEKNSIPALDPFEPLAAAVEGASEIASSEVNQQQGLSQPEKRITAIDSLPSPAIAQQPLSTDPAASEMRDMAPSPPATPLPLPTELAQAPIPSVGELSTPALMTPPPNIAAVEQQNVPPELNEEPFVSAESLSLTVLDMDNVPELTLRILESQEPSAAEASDLRQPLDEPSAEIANTNESNSDNKALPQLDNEQVADLNGSSMQPPAERASDIPEPPQESLTNAQSTPQLALAQTEKIEGAPSVQLPAGTTGEGEQSATAITGSYNLAVANGNGVRGIARATSTWLDTEDLNITEVVDADNFEYSQTVIRHRPEFAQFAMEMAAQMAVNCDIQVTDELLDGVDMQLILGQDFASNVKVKDGWLSFGDEEINQVESELRIEISNGNGVGGMAGRLRNFLQAKGSSIVRITNADNYGYGESVLYYRPGNREAAEELLSALPVKDVLLQESTNLAEQVDARLLLGRDFVPYDIGPGET